MTPQVQHHALIGTTRYGKSQLAIALNVPRMLRHDRPAYVVIDPAGSMAENIAIHLLFANRVAKGMVVYDKVCETDLTPGYPIFSPSQNPDPRQREAENNQLKSELKAILVRAEGKLDTESNQKIDEGLEDLLDLWINQQTPVPFFWLRNAFHGDTPEHKYLVARCTKEEVAHRFRRYAGMNDRDWEYNCGPAERRVRKACRIPAFRNRCVSSFDLTEFLNAGGVLLLDGSSRGNLSRQDQAFVLSMILLTLIQLARSGRFTRRVVIVLDEGQASGILDANIARSLSESGKWNLEFVLIFQNPFTLPIEVRDAVFQNCDDLYFLHQVSPDATSYAARMIAVPQFSGDKIKFTQYTTRLADDGLEEIQTHSKSTSKGHDGTTHGHTHTEGVQYRQKRREVKEAHHTTFSLDEEIKLKEQMIANLGVGEFMRKSGTYVSERPEYLPMLERSWHRDKFNKKQTVGQRKLERTLAEMKATHPAYKTQVDSPPTWTETPPKKTAKPKNPPGIG